MPTRILLLIGLLAMSTLAQPAIEPGVSHELAKWRAAHYSDVRYKLNLTLEKMSPVLKGTIEIRVNVKGSPPYEGGVAEGRGGSLIILDWRKIRGHEEKSTIANVSVNGIPLIEGPLLWNEPGRPRGFHHDLEHLVFADGVVNGENVIKLDFTSPILTSGSAVTRYVDKEDGSEYIYSLFVPSDASTAFPVFDQPDLKARFSVRAVIPRSWTLVTNTQAEDDPYFSVPGDPESKEPSPNGFFAPETKPISTYVFAFAAGPFERVSVPPAVAGGLTRSTTNAAEPKTASVKSASTNANLQPPATAGGTDSHADLAISVYVRKSQAEKFKPHAAEVFRLNREAIKYFEQYFDYKFPFPEYDLVLIPEFPFGGMEHAGATFLRESSIIFPQEPTKNDHISRALLMFHEASHQWFGDTVTMRWFDDLWLKEGFATFTAYKAMEKIMPEMNAWKVFYERVKQAAYQTDSTKGTTPIYQEIKNLSAAKSAYGNIVYNKAPAFLRQAEFYLGEDKFQTAVRAFLKKHKFANAGWEGLVGEFEASTKKELSAWSRQWVLKPGVPTIRIDRMKRIDGAEGGYALPQDGFEDQLALWDQRVKTLRVTDDGKQEVLIDRAGRLGSDEGRMKEIRPRPILYYIPNFDDRGYGIFLLDDKSREYVLKNIQNEKDPFQRSMMWGALWDSVREGELDPKEYVELVVKVLSSAKVENHPVTGSKNEPVPPLLRKEGSQIVDDESTVALLLNRVSTAMNYYIDTAGPQAPLPASAQRAETAKRRADAVQTGSLRSNVEDLLIERMRNAETLGQRITFYRAFLNVGASEKARLVLKEMLYAKPPSSGGESVPPAVAEGSPRPTPNVSATMPNTNVQPPATAGGTDIGRSIPLKPKDKFDIVTRLIILGDPHGLKMLAELEKTETGDDAKRWAYAARAGIPTAENKAKYWNDFVANKDISESWIEAAFGPWNSASHERLTLPYLERALKELPNHKRNRKIFFVNGWLGAFIGGQRSEEALAVVNKFLADHPQFDNDLRLKILENADVIERAVPIRAKYER